MSDDLRLILASKSPRRAALLRQIGLEFTVRTASVDEDTDIADPEEHVSVLSRKKAEAVAETEPYAWVIGADTIVCLDGEILGKPRDAGDASRMLRRLSGRAHQVYTGFTLIPGRDRIRTDVVCTDVTFRDLSENEILAYAASGEPMDKAGAYGIQGRAALFVRSVNGCYFNVVGFPVARFYERMRELLDSRTLHHLFFKPGALK